MAAPAQLPPAVDDVLLALGRQKGLSAALSSLLNAVYRYTLRAFLQSPPNRADVVKALDKIKQGLALGRSAPGESPDALLLPKLLLLAQILEGQSTPDAPPAPAPPARTVLQFVAPPPPVVAAPPPPVVVAPPPPVVAAAPPPVVAPPSFPPPLEPWSIPADLASPAPGIWRSPPLIEPPAPAAPPPQPLPPPTETGDGDPRHRSLPPDQPRKSAAIAAALLSNLAGLHSRRQALLASRLATWWDFSALDKQIQETMHGVSWLGHALHGPAESALAGAPDDADGFAAVLTLLHCGGGSTDVALAYLAERSTEATGALDGPLLALRMMTADAALLARVEPLLTTAGGGVRASLLTALAERGRTSADELVALLDDADDAIACRAAELLAWLGRAPTDARELEVRLHKDDSPRRRCGLLYAAVALGSTRALREVRRMLDAGEIVTARAIDALAVAGAAADAERLLHLAARDEELAALAVLAAGHLGNPLSAEAIAMSAADEGTRDWARRTILGDDGDDGDAAPPRHAGERLLHGVPWTVAGALARLAAPDELLRARRWYALELVVRAGARPKPPVVFDAEACAALQNAATAELSGAVQARRRPISSGGWGD